MAEKTSNYNLEKQQLNDYVDIEGLNENFDIIDEQIKNVSNKADQAFQSASNGKSAIKTAITGVDPKVTVPTDATFSQLATAIGQIKTGVDTEDATAKAEQILAGMTAYVKGAKVTGTMPDCSGASQANYTATDMYSANTQILLKPPVGYYNPNGDHNNPTQLSGWVYAADSNFVSDNIKAGKSIFGVSGKSSVVDTADATATAPNILSGNTAYVNGNKITGIMPNNDTRANWAAKDVYTSGGTVYLKPQPGCYNPGGSSSDGSSIGGWVSAYSSGLFSGNILSGKSIFGVVGTAIEGKRWASGTVNIQPGGTFITSSGLSVTSVFVEVSGLNFKPSIIITWPYKCNPTNFTIYNSNDESYLGVPLIMTIATQLTYNYIDTPTNSAGRHFRLTGNAYVANTGFKLPVFDGLYDRHNWIAYE
ncbi:hypothetical protein [Anaerocolumna xylanovorans]|uniref:Phage tail fibre repeat-containing protein n=1 Tax=Anaerocolumna xylanovorans DSM 12503 TaxID=1121345 RepID=A0A1M7Y6L5_9FIRM|nr:hypothetical protein [Anaerocolumna xylanovorans]SHO48158.1 hypothetical protein SAMN02745217_01700 [Anaerocolumna xylanovorans DSM 12503]